MRILILNGPNLNLLGQREPEIYGTQSLGDLENQFRKTFQGQGVDFEWYQTNHEGHLIDALHKARNRGIQGIVFNPGGYCHTSVALRDAISAIKLPVVEVHISNIYAREEFRRHSLTVGVCVGQISGLGIAGYELAVQALLRILRTPQAVVEPVRQVERVVEAREVRETREERPEDARREDARREEAKREEAKREEAKREEARREEQEREGKRRRRGRRGGRGRRRGEQEEAPRDEREVADTVEHEVIDIAERYSNLKGVVVRRGLDVLAEMGEENEEEAPPPSPKGLVTFRDEEEGFQAYAAAPQDEESTFAVTPGRTREPHRHAPPAPAPVEAPAPASAEPVTAGVEMVAPQEPEHAVVETEETPIAPVEEAPAATEAPAEGVETPAAEGEAEAETEAPKGARGRGRRKTTSGGRRRSTPRKKAEE